MPRNFNPNKKDEEDDFEVDLDGVENNSQYYVPPGNYQGQLISLTKKQSSSGNPMWVWDFVVVEDGPAQGKELRVFTALTPAAMWKVAETIEALGLGETGGKVKFNKKEAIGKQCMLEVADDEYNGKTVSRVQRTYPAEKEMDSIPF